MRNSRRSANLLRDYSGTLSIVKAVGSTPTPRSDSGTVIQFGRLETEPEPEPEAAWPPAQIGQYRVLEVLGQGGMGCVLVVEDTLLRRRAAVKVLDRKLAKLPEARKWFLLEAQAMA